MSTVRTSADLRCSTQARAADLVPLGTAVTADALVLVEVPLPWPSEISDHPALSELPAVLAPLGARIQGLVPSAESLEEGLYRVTLHHRPPGPFRAYRRTERAVPLDELTDACRTLVTEAQEPRPADDPEPEPGSVRRDVLVCGHGSRDRCCGSLGTALWASLDHRAEVRIARTSHLGGHRFAATALVLPEGTAWAWLDGELLGSVIDRSVPVAEVIEHYRGSTAMADAVTKAAEAAVFGEVGWSWLDEARSAEIVEVGEDRWQVEVRGDAAVWRATVVSHGLAPQPKCGTDEPSGKEDPQVEVVELARTS